MKTASSCLIGTTNIVTDFQGTNQIQNHVTQEMWRACDTDKFFEGRSRAHGCTRI